MRVYLLKDMVTKNESEMRNWSKIASIINYGNSPHKLYVVSRSHTAIIFKITFADYHYFILDQLYRPDETPRNEDTKMRARAEMNSIVYSLYSALDSLANEINLAYNFGIGENKIQITHNHPKSKYPKSKSDCVRCSLDNKNDKLKSTLNQELSQNWFVLFNKLRNQITHKNLPVIHQSYSNDAMHIAIPEDPTEMNPNIHTKLVEINVFCMDLRNYVLRATERVLDLLEIPIKNTFNL
jgi:hypothetical protein